MTVRWGVIGTGGIARSFVGDCVAAGVEFVAVGSRTQQAADAFAAEFGIPRAHGSYADLVADDAVDAVYVATPHARHAEDALLAIAAGKHVLVEKAFTITAAEARAVVDAARTAGVAVTEAMWTRFLPQAAMIRQALAEGRIGRPVLVEATHHQALPTDPGHRLRDPALGGGALLDLGIYPVSFAVDVLGVPTAVAAAGTLSDQGVDTQMGLVLTHEGGAQSMLHFGMDLRSPNTASVIGESGRIDLDATWFTPTTWRIRDADGEVVEEFDGREELTGYAHEARAFEAMVTSGVHDGGPMDPDETVAIMALMDEARRQVGVRYAADGPPDAA
ncbi:MULTISPECIES: Gfo/Idh/MocA family protein [unclassified Curtobacterium]|uniref:Gfo/Idh/MocA family protein n=1 Tax=unclassified Curtobacterium TaxID=257496 RepID=UPI0008DDD2BE|nr:MULTISPECIES: Gfo/Idh/MocA family oxidoreductase [unclassified Curtobacterium]OIH93218.1 oxidoreductase [Curtobacterium sp. MCBA15_003]OII10495.1 oxidoreductase [Curtobacterium sp. MCBA15_009]OII30129.1 oxidoreductase [Curtobacterium sp. MMLR14_006]